MFACMIQFKCKNGRIIGIGIRLQRRNLPSSRHAPANRCLFEMLEPPAQCSKKGGFIPTEHKQEKFLFMVAACENCFTSLVKKSTPVVYRSFRCNRGEFFLDYYMESIHCEVRCVSANSFPLLIHKHAYM